MKRAVFLDRDGVINELVYYRNRGMVDSPFTLGQFRLLPGVAQAIKNINEAGFKAIVVSNQPGVARNHFTKKILDSITVKMRKELARKKAFLDAVYYCPHDPKGKNKNYRKRCNCRKPRTGIILNASKIFNISLKHSFMIGDELSDIEAGKSAGCKTILLGKMKCQICRLMEEGEVYPDSIVSDLLEASKYIKKEVANENIHRQRRS